MFNEQNLRVILRVIIARRMPFAERNAQKPTRPGRKLNDAFVVVPNVFIMCIYNI